MIKKCNECKETKPVSEFYVKKYYGDGFHSRCKECMKAGQRAWNQRNPDYNKIYGKLYRLILPVIERPRKYDLVKARARNQLFYAVKTGVLVRPTSCQRCGATCKPEAHHADYTKPLEVEWFCSPCHNVIDRGEYTNENR